jgi:hypothetical protein
MFRRLAALAVLLAAVLVTACGSKPKPHHTQTVTIAPQVVNACPQAIQGHGAMGGCSPAPVIATPKRLNGIASSVSGVGGTTYPDLSNNDPCVCAATLKAHGHPAEVDKANQGVGFLDGTFYRMVVDAKAHGLAVGGYDFDSEYTTGEAYAFVGQLHRAGIWRNTPNTLPPTLDVEYGNASRAGIERQLSVLRQQFGRVQIYTGGWYWLPTLGCWWPKGVQAWLSGYPSASVFCGLPESLFAVHQYTDHGYNGASFSDMNVWRGSPASWAAFIHKPVAQPSRAQRLALLKSDQAAVLKLSKLLDRHHCRHGSAQPHSFHTLCSARWKPRGDLLHKQIVQLQHELGIKSHASSFHNISLVLSTPTSIVTQLSASKASVEVVSEPLGTTAVHVAIMQTLAGAGVKYLDLPASQHLYTPPAASPVVDMQAKGSAGAIGGWAGRLATVPAGVQEEPPHEEPPPSSMIVGIDAGGWAWDSAVHDFSGAARYVRSSSGYYNTDSQIGLLAKYGVHLLPLFSGNPITANRTAYAEGVLSWFKRYGKGGTYWAGKTDLGATTAEIVNEPGNPYFYGGGARTDQASYAALIEQANTTLATLGAKAPRLLVSYDGGYEGDAYGRALLKADPHLASLNIGYTVHPYGGHNNREQSALGGRSRVLEAPHPVYVTEVGWPTDTAAGPTGDSFQWTEQQQAENITRWIGWTRSLGYVAATVNFNWADYGPNNWYGLVKAAGFPHKLSYAALAKASAE